MVSFVGKRITAPDKLVSCQITFWTQVLIWGINQLLLSFSVLMELVVHIFFANNFVRRGSSIIIILVSFYITYHYSYLK